MNSLPHAIYLLVVSRSRWKKKRREREMARLKFQPLAESKFSTPRPQILNGRYHSSANRPYLFFSLTLPPGAVGGEKEIVDSFAYMEMSLILAKMLYTYDMALIEPDVDWVAGCRVHVQWWKPKLRVRLTPRRADGGDGGGDEGGEA